MTVLLLVYLSGCHPKSETDCTCSECGAAYKCDGGPCKCEGCECQTPPIVIEGVPPIGDDAALSPPMVRFGSEPIVVSPFLQRVGSCGPGGYRLSLSSYRVAVRPSEAEFVERINITLQGEVENRLRDGTRVDILTDALAIEVDFAEKWYEALGQSCHYARHTGRHPVLYLIVMDEGDERFVDRALETAKIVTVKIDGRDLSPVVIAYREYKKK